MKLRQILSVVVVSLLPVLSGVTQGCVIQDDSQQSDNITQLSDYEMNVAAANEVWHSEVPITKPADAWTALVKVGDQTLPAPTHLFGDTVNIIPYSNEDGVDDASGATFKYGDQEIAKVFKPGQVGISLKMHRPEHRVVDLNNADASAMKEDFKLQDTHIQLIVGVEKAEHGKAGAISLNNPQAYEEGRFGNPQYSMIFFRPIYPSFASSRQAAYEANVLATLMMFNSVTSFPGNYNGGDPLGAHTPERLRTYVDNAVRAIAGDAEAKAWFQLEENLVYCAELAFIALSAGLHEPLTAENLVPRVGEDVWSKFVEQVTIHNKGVDEFKERGSISEENLSNFVRFNDNQRVAMVRIPAVEEDLPPISELSADSAGRMAFRPMTMADIVRQFMRTHIPRQTLGEALAPVQGAVLAKMKPGLLESMAMDQLPATDPRRVAVEQLFDEIVQVVGTSYESYQAFQQALEPYMAQANSIAGPRPGDESGAGLYAPPSLMHVVAQGHHLGGLVGLQYEGHGVHVSAVQKKNLSSPEPEPTPVDDIADEVSCRAAGDQQENSCGMQAPGGCWCDDYCSEAGDCCADAPSVCGS